MLRDRDRGRGRDASKKKGKKKKSGSIGKERAMRNIHIPYVEVSRRTESAIRHPSEMMSGCMWKEESWLRGGLDAKRRRGMYANSFLFLRFAPRIDEKRKK